MGVFTPNTIAGTCSSGPLASSFRRALRIRRHRLGLAVPRHGPPVLAAARLPGARPQDRPGRDRGQSRSRPLDPRPRWTPLLRHAGGAGRRRRDSPSQREQPHRRPPPVEQAPEGAKTGHPRPDRRHPAIPPVLQLTFSRQGSSPLARVAPREPFGALPTRLGSPQFDAERTLSFAVLLRSITRPAKLRSIDRNSVSPCDAETRHPSQPYEIRKQLTWHNGC